MQQLNRIELHEQALALILNINWFQEDIAELSHHIFLQFTHIEIKEHAQGADRESYRFIWQNQPLTLHFDVYSQSIWFESLAPDSADLLNLLKQQIPLTLLLIAKQS